MSLQCSRYDSHLAMKLVAVDGNIGAAGRGISSVSKPGLSTQQHRSSHQSSRRADNRCDAKY